MRRTTIPVTAGDSLRLAQVCDNLISNATQVHAQGRLCVGEPLPQGQGRGALGPRHGVRDPPGPAGKRLRAHVPHQARPARPRHRARARRSQRRSWTPTTARSRSRARRARARSSGSASRSFPPALLPPPRSRPGKPTRTPRPRPPERPPGSIHLRSPPMRAAAIQLEAVVGDVDANLATPASGSADDAGAAGRRVDRAARVLLDRDRLRAGARGCRAAAGRRRHRAAAAARRAPRRAGRRLVPLPRRRRRGPQRLRPGRPDGSVAGRHDKDLPTMWENSFYVGGHDDGVIEAGAGLTAGAARLLGADAHADGAPAARASRPRDVGGSGWWSHLAQLGPAGADRAAWRSATSAGAPRGRGLRRYVGAPVVHAAHAGSSSARCRGSRCPTAATSRAATLICAADGTVLARRDRERGRGRRRPPRSSRGRTVPPAEPPDDFWLHPAARWRPSAWHVQRPTAAAGTATTSSRVRLAPGNGIGKRRSAQLSVGIVGAGFGGVGMAIRLRQDGLRATSRSSSAATRSAASGARTPTRAPPATSPRTSTRSRSRPGHDWSRRYAPQAEILRYLERAPTSFGSSPHLRFGTEVAAATFDAEAGRWTLTTAAGESHEFDVLVTACGQLTRPRSRRSPGSRTSRGRPFTRPSGTTTHDLTGRNVAVIGTGASAIQFVPAIAPQTRAARRSTSARRRGSCRRPTAPTPSGSGGSSAASRPGSRRAGSGSSRSSRPRPTASPAPTGCAGRSRGSPTTTAQRELPDPELRAKATPDYEFGCKRVLFTSDWYPTLRRPNVELVAGGVERVTADGVVGADGVEREADTIIWGTGFRRHNFVAPMDVQGLGRPRAERASGRARRGLPGHDRLGLSEHVRALRPEHEPRLGLRALHARVASSTTCSTRCSGCASGGLRWIDLKPEVQAAGARRSPSAATTPSGPPAAAPAGT